MSRRKGNDDIPERNPYPGIISAHAWRAYWLWEGQGKTYAEVQDALGLKSKEHAAQLVTRARGQAIRIRHRERRDGIVDDLDALVERIANEPRGSWAADYDVMRDRIIRLKREAERLDHHPAGEDDDE